MKSWTVALFLIAAGTAFGGEADLEAHKKSMIDEWSGRIAELEKAKSCVAAATSKDAVQTCKKQLKEERESRAEAHVDEKIKKLQDKKANMNK